MSKSIYWAVKETKHKKKLNNKTQNLTIAEKLETEDSNYKNRRKKIITVNIYLYVNLVFGLLNYYLGLIYFFNF